MTPALGIRTCAVTGCSRRVMTTADERCVYGRCEFHVSALLRVAFGPDTPNEGARGQTPSGVPAVQRADALAGCSSDGGSPETERAIARATPGPASQPDSPLGARHVEGTPAPACRAPSEAPDMATQPAA